MKGWKSQDKETAKQTRTSILSVKRFFTQISTQPIVPAIHLAASANQQTIWSQNSGHIWQDNICFIDIFFFCFPTGHSWHCLCCQEVFLICLNATRKYWNARINLPTVLQKRKGDLLLPIHKSDAAKDEKYFLSDSEETRRLDSPSQKYFSKYFDKYFNKYFLSDFEETVPCS